MAKAKVNKSQAIRDALKANRGKSPKAISEILKGQGLDVPPQYISAIKSNMKRKGRRRKAAKAGAAKSVGGNSLQAAVELVKAAGGLEAAKQALGTVVQLAKFGAENT